MESERAYSLLKFIREANEKVCIDTLLHLASKNPGMVMESIEELGLVNPEAVLHPKAAAVARRHVGKLEDPTEADDYVYWMECLRRNNIQPHQKVDAIKYRRQMTGNGLKEAKYFIDTLWDAYQTY